MLAYGSYARGDYPPESDIDLLVVMDSKRYSSRNLKSLVDARRFCRREFKVSLEVDILLDSEVDLWNRGILFEGHSFVDLSFYNKDGEVLFGSDVRNSFRIPEDLPEKAQVVLEIIEAEFKRWFLEGKGKKYLVPHWMTGWLLVTFLNSLGIFDVARFEETCKSIENISALAITQEFRKYKQRREITAEEFIKLQRIIKSHSQQS